MYDLHLHSHYSDGDLAPGDIVAELALRGVRGLALTDHNGVWGQEEVREAARQHGLQSVEGIEVSARFGEADVHVLGYSRLFDREVLRARLATTREGYAERLRAMVELCQQAGYQEVTYEEIERRRAYVEEPSYISYDLGRVLTDVYSLSVQEARKLTTAGGACHVAYGDWALSPLEAVDVIHEAGGVAVLGHPGILASTLGADGLVALINDLAGSGLEGLEVYHPVHEATMIDRLQDTADALGLLVTGGSDWHGPGRYGESDERLGKVGVEGEEFQKLMSAIRPASS